MSKELEQVMKFLVPQYRFLAHLMFGRKKTELEALRARIKTGLTSNSIVVFDQGKKELNIDLYSLEKEKGKIWVSLLKKQLKILEETIKV